MNCANRLFFILQADGQPGTVQHLDAVALEPQHLIHVQQQAPVADKKVLLRLQLLGFKLLVFNDRDPQLHRYAPPLQFDRTTFFRPLHLPFTHETPPFTQNCPIGAAKACRKTSNPPGLPASCRFLHNLYFFIPFFTFFQKRIDSAKPA